MNWMHFCRKAAELLSQSLDEPLGPIDRLRLRVHMSMCSNCRNVEQQIKGIEAMSADLFANGPPLADESPRPLVAEGSRHAND